MEYLRWLFIAVAVVLFFGASIFFHELGHYWMALRRGMKVEGFSIGLGPKAFSWMFQGVEWSIRWIPAGGFVKLPQMITSEAIEGKADAEIPPASPVSRILVAAAGPAMNVLFALAIASLIWVIGLPMLVNPPVIGPVEKDSPEAKLGIQERDRIVAVDGNAVKSWEEVSMEVITARTNVLPVVIEHQGVRTTYQLATRSSPLLGLKWLNLDPLDRPVIGLVRPDMPAAKAGMLTGDKFLTFAGIAVLNQQHLMELIGKGEGKPCDIVVERAGQRRTFTVTPVYDAKEKRGLIGIGFAGGRYEVQRPGPTPWEQFDEVFTRMGKTFTALAHSKETGVGAKDLSGPVGILGGLAVELKTDLRLGLRFLVMLNLNLALLNLLPLPVLDGGHITMALFELVTRRKVSLRFQEYATTSFALLLISFMLYVTFFDLRRVPLFKALLQQRNLVESAAPKPSQAR